MKNLSSLFSRFVLTIAGALALGACNRSEYAMLPRSASYLGTAPAAYTPRPAAPVAARPQAAPAAEAAPVAPAAQPEAVAPAQAVAATPVAKPAPALAAQAPAAVANTTPPTAAPKLNLVQRLAVNKAMKKLDKLAAKSPQFKKGDASASTARLDGNLRTGIILVVIGLLVGLLNGLIGTIIAIIGLVFILLWLLDAL